MKLLWTSKALSDLARLHEFLAPANQAAAARAVQALSRAPAILPTKPGPLAQQGSMCLT